MDSVGNMVLVLVKATMLKTIPKAKQPSGATLDSTRGVLANDVSTVDGRLWFDPTVSTKT